MTYFQMMHEIQLHHDMIRALMAEEDKARTNMDAQRINEITAEKSVHYAEISKLEEMVENYDLTEEEIKEHFAALLGNDEEEEV